MIGYYWNGDEQAYDGKSDSNKKMLKLLTEKEYTEILDIYTNGVIHYNIYQLMNDEPKSSNEKLAKAQKSIANNMTKDTIKNQTNYNIKTSKEIDQILQNKETELETKKTN
ncbi:MAG: hypothetical protein IJU54_03095 [Alphaproteobacteria bacterium]|nr:hypothetical protein [Alphaproteobacteria bacterium]